MNRVAAFFRLEPRQRSLVLTAWRLLWLARLGLWLRPLPTLQSWSERRGPAKPEGPTPGAAAWAVATMAPFVPKATCLVQALAARRLLARYGHEADLRIGVTRDAAGSFLAHAWLEQGGTVVLGALPDLERYRPLTPARGRGAL